MATVNKDFRVKHGLVVEGANATVDGSDIITEDAILAGNGEGGNENVTVSYDAETKKVTFAAAPGYSDQDVKDVLTGSTQTNISITEVEGVLTITAENGVEDSDTDDLDEGETNLYFTDQRALDATAEAYDPAGAAAQALTDAEDYADGLATNYEAAGAVSTHSDLTTGVHGVTGDVVGTTDTQDISNKRIVDTLYFTDGVTVADEGQIAVLAGSHDFEIKANFGDLTLKTMAEDADVVISSDDGDIVLNADGSSYITSVSAGNEIATHAYVDNAIAGLSWKDSVNLFATSNVPLTGNTETVIIDGHAALDGTDDGYRLLLTNQTTDTENGIYVYADNGTTYTLTRSEDADTVAELIGAAVFVKEGTQYGSTSWVQADHYVTTFDGLTWTQFSGSGSVTAGEGIDVDGLEIAVDRTTVDTWYDAAGTAQGIVDDLDTDDIEEGETNLYFTDTRAVDALEAVVPNFTAVEVNSVAKQVAAIVYAATEDVPVVAFAFAKADYRSAKFLVKVAYSTHTEVSEVLLTLDTSDNIAITEFAVVSTNGSASSISAGISGSNVQLLVTPNNNGSTVTVFGTLLSEDLLLS
jgi:hypothetical protein